MDILKPVVPLAIAEIPVLPLFMLASAVSLVLRFHRTVEVFTRRLRSEVDLDAVRADLLLAVDTTLQPASVGLWLRPQGHEHP